jgi:signal peptidase II
LKKYLSDYAYLFVFSGLIIGLDQWTKVLVRANLSFSDRWSPWPWLEPYASIVHWQNTGAAFGMLPNLSAVFTVLAVIVSGAILYYFPQTPRHDRTLRLAMVLQLAGALGNLIDRLTQGGFVTDFIALFSIWNMPVFNIADLSISSGVVVLLVGLWLKERAQKTPAVPEGEVPLPQPEDPRGE